MIARPLKLGAGQLRQLVYDRFLGAFEGAARDALAARRPAKIGFFYDGNFDPTDQINRDRRGDNDQLPDGDKKDNQFFLIRVDGTDNAPIAAIPIFGEHGTLNDDDNPLAVRVSARRCAPGPSLTPRSCAMDRM